MTDVLLFDTPDGGNIEFVGGRATMSDGLYAAVFLSLFGGNEEDSGEESDDRKQWWGNLGERDAARRYRSATQNLLRSLPLVPANLRRIEDAASDDLAWFTDTGLASSVRADVSIPALNTIKLDVSIEIDGNVFDFSFTTKKLSDGGQTASPI